MCDSETTKYTAARMRPCLSCHLVFDRQSSSIDDIVGPPDAMLRPPTSVSLLLAERVARLDILHSTQQLSTAIVVDDRHRSQQPADLL